MLGDHHLAEPDGQAAVVGTGTTSQPPPSTPASRVEEATGTAVGELARRAGSAQVPDAFLRWHVEPGSVQRAWTCGRAVGVVTDRRRGRSLLVVGDPVQAAPLVAQALAGEPVERVTLPVGTPERLVATAPDVAARLHGGADWDWFWTAEAPVPPLPGETGVEVLDAGTAQHPGPDAAALRALIAASSERSSAHPGDPHARLWMGVRRGQDLLACVCSTDEDGSTVPHLAAVATHPAARGRGLGAAVTAAVTRHLLAAGSPVVTLGMYADNDVARRMYERLGWTRSHAFASRVVRPR